MEPFLGFIGAFGFAFAPRDWSRCEGQLIGISQKSALYAVLGTTYGGDGRTTFALPDLRGRTSIGFGGGPALPVYRIGEKPGREGVALSSQHLPAHTHAATVTPGYYGSLSVTLEASTENGDHDIPQQGDYLATSFKSRGDLNKNYIPDNNSFSSSNMESISSVAVQCDYASGSVTVGATGASQLVPVIQPSLAINYSIALQGIFPSRN